MDSSFQWKTGTTRVTAACAGLLCLSLTAACGGGGSKNAAPPSPDVWATVDGRELKREDVEKVYRRVAQQSPVPSEEEAMTAKLSMLNELIVQDILVARAAELKIEVTPADLDAAFNERKKNMPEDAFQKELAARGLTSDDMKASLRRELLAEKVVDREVTSKVSVTDQEVSDYYNAHRAQFNIAEPAYRLAQIVITPVRDQQIANRQQDDAVTPEAADKKAAFLMEKLKAGTPFSEVARDFSEDPESAPNGGDLGFVPLSSLKQAPPMLRDAALKSSPGTVSHVASGGAHTLVLLIAKEEPGQRDLNTPGVKDNISSSLRSRREQLLRTAYLSAARADSNVVNYLARQIVQAQGKSPSLMPLSPGKK
jgi:peptidyl-prolyl cis-trans isomerase SurA